MGIIEIEVVVIPSPKTNTVAGNRDKPKQHATHLFLAIEARMPQQEQQSPSDEARSRIRKIAVSYSLNFGSSYKSPLNWPVRITIPTESKQVKIDRMATTVTEAFLSLKHIYILIIMMSIRFF